MWKYECYLLSLRLDGLKCLNKLLNKFCYIVFLVVCEILYNVEVILVFCLILFNLSFWIIFLVSFLFRVVVLL